MKKKKIVLVDMDGVLADFEGEFLRRWKRKYPYEVVIELKDRKTHGIIQQYPRNLKNKILSIAHEKGFFQYLPPITGGKEALFEMEESGYSIFICTKPTIVYTNCVLEKYHWIESNLGNDWTQRIIFTRDKTLVRGNYLIDDSPHIRGLLNPIWEHVIFDAPYNRDVTGQKRLKDWSEWKNVILNSHTH